MAGGPGSPGRGRGDPPGGRAARRGGPRGCGPRPRRSPRAGPARRAGRPPARDGRPRRSTCSATSCTSPARRGGRRHQWAAAVRWRSRFCSVAAVGRRGRPRRPGRSRRRPRSRPPAGGAGEVGSYLGTPLVTAAGSRRRPVRLRPRARATGPTSTSPPCGSSPPRSSPSWSSPPSSTSSRATGCAGAWPSTPPASARFDWDLRTGELTWDDRLIEMFGYTATTFDQSIEAFNARLHPDDLPRVSEALQTSIDTCGEYDAEYRVVLPDGETRWVHARGRAVADAHGRAARRARRRLRHHRRAGRRGPGHPGARGHARRLLLAGPRVAVHLRQRRGRAAARTPARRAARAGRCGRPSPPRSTASSRTATARRCAPASRCTSTRTTRLRWTAGTSCGPGPAPTGCPSTSSRSPSGAGRSSRPSGPAARLALLARVSAELARHARRRGGDRAAAPAGRAGAGRLRASSPSIDADGQPRDVGTLARRPGRARRSLERYAAVRLASMPLTAPVAPGAAPASAATTFAGEDVLELLPPGDGHGAARPPGARHRGRAAPARPRPHPRPADALLRRRPRPDRRRPRDRPGRRRPGRPGLDNARLYAPAAAARRGAAAQPAHRAAGARPRRDRRPVPAGRGGRPRSAATGTTPSCSRTARRCWSSATSSGTTPRPRRRWASCAACCAASPTYSDAGPVEVLRGLDASMRRCSGARSPPRPSPASSRPTTSARAASPACAGPTPGTCRRWSINPDGSVAELAVWAGDLLLGVDPASTRARAVVTAGPRRDRAALHRRADRAPRRRPRRRPGPAARGARRARRPAAAGAARRGARPAGARPARGRRRPGRRPPAPRRTGPRPPEAGPNVVPPTVPR